MSDHEHTTDRYEALSEALAGAKDRREAMAACEALFLARLTEYDVETQPMDMAMAVGYYRDGHTPPSASLIEAQLNWALAAVCDDIREALDPDTWRRPEEGRVAALAGAWQWLQGHTPWTQKGNIGRWRRFGEQTSERITEPDYCEAAHAYWVADRDWRAAVDQVGGSLHRALGGIATGEVRRAAARQRARMFGDTIDPVPVMGEPAVPTEHCVGWERDAGEWGWRLTLVRRDETTVWKQLGRTQRPVRIGALSLRRRPPYAWYRNARWQDGAILAELRIHREDWGSEGAEAMLAMWRLEPTGPDAWHIEWRVGRVGVPAPIGAEAWAYLADHAMAGGDDELAIP